jgi:hypothetical protein
MGGTPTDARRTARFVGHRAHNARAVRQGPRMPIKCYTDSAETSLGLGPVVDTVVADLVVDYPDDTKIGIGPTVDTVVVAAPLAWSDDPDDEPEPPVVKPVKLKPKPAKPKPQAPPNPVPYSWRYVWLRAGLIAAPGMVIAVLLAGFPWSYFKSDQADSRGGWEQPGVSWTPLAPFTTADPGAQAKAGRTIGPVPYTQPPAPIVTMTQTPAAAPTVTVTAPPPTTAAPAPAAAPSPDRDRKYLANLRLAGITITDPQAAIRSAHNMCTYLAAGHTEQQTVAELMSENASLTRNNAVTVVDSAIAFYCPQEN